jgi:nucleotide-binding universal stress UspA family protein
MEVNRGGNMKALICVDGSPVTNEGFKCAVDALRTDIDYTLLYVLEEHGIYDSYKRIFREDLERIEELFEDVGSEKEAAKKAFVLPLCEYMRERGLSARAVVREGPAGDEILDELRGGAYDFVVLGDRKSLSPTRRLLGGTLTEVMRNADTCVMIVRPSRP